MPIAGPLTGRLSATVPRVSRPSPVQGIGGRSAAAGHDGRGIPRKPGLQVALRAPQGTRRGDGGRQLRMPAAPQDALVPGPWVGSRGRPAERVDGVGTAQQVTHLQVQVGAGRVAGVAAERDHLAAAHLLPGMREERGVVVVDRAAPGGATLMLYPPRSVRAAHTTTPSAAASTRVPSATGRSSPRCPS